MGKEKSCLITQNLVSAIAWYDTAPHSLIKPEQGGNGEITWKDKAWKDLSMLVAREYGDFPVEARQGVDFEKMVYAKASMLNRALGTPEFEEVCATVKGMQFFQKGGKYITVDGHKCYVYAKYDVIKLPMIKDIKTTKKYTKNKYLSTVQHPIYCFISGADRFEYVIAEWDEYPKIKAIHYEEYMVVDRTDLEETITIMISQTLERLKDLGLWDIYKEKYCMY
jgi:hypothetical protein